MYKRLGVRALLTFGCLFGIMARSAYSQAVPEPVHDTVDVAMSYNESGANAVGGYGFWMEGGNVQVQDRAWRQLGVVADVAGLHTGTTHDPNVGLDLLTMTFGPRYTWSPVQHRFSIFGEFLVGEAFGMDSLFPSGSAVSASASSFALQTGGGIDLPVSRRISIRAFEAEWLRTQLPNATTNVQNNLRLGVGVIYRIK